MTARSEGGVRLSLHPLRTIDEWNRSSFHGGRRREIAPAWLAGLSWLASRPERWFWALTHLKVWDVRHVLNLTAIRFGRLKGPYRSRYPSWATSIGGSCGMETEDGFRCHISGLGHPGPCRTGPILPRRPYPIEKAIR